MQASPGVFTMPSTSSDLFFAAGGMLPECDTTGDSLLAFWGYRFSIGEVIGFLTMFYVLFHIGSYLALSKLYRQKR
jgi:ATP-binding cassette, subfamily G (WHITE), member 2